MKKNFLPILCLILVLSLAGCGGSSSSSTAPANSSSSSSQAIALPVGIPGSFMADVSTGLETARGIPAGEMKFSGDNSLFSSSISSKYTKADSGIEFDYTLLADSKTQILSSSFGITNTKLISDNDFLDAAGSYMSLCATMQYTTADTDKAAKWVNDNIQTLPVGVENTIYTNIGDAQFSLVKANNANGGLYMINMTIRSLTDVDAIDLTESDISSSSK